MSTTLSYGFVRPATGDKGSTFWGQLENDITQLNDHTHNGSDSALLTATSFLAVSQTISAASWAHQGAGTYRQTVTMPASITTNGGVFDDYLIQFRDNTSGQVITPTVERVTPTTFYVYINDNTITLKAKYI